MIFWEHARESLQPGNNAANDRTYPYKNIVTGEFYLETDLLQVIFLYDWITQEVSPRDTQGLLYIQSE